MYDKHTHLYGVRAEKEPTSEARCCRRRHSWGPICRAPAELSGANLKGVTLEGAALGGAYVRHGGRAGTYITRHDRRRLGGINRRDERVEKQ